ncbi:MAG: helix-turn-helix transcriptional regulator [Bacteroidales bacterium]|nr:helix-turn-helix transcriptional regulator [Bacteroidales bacterium]
MKNSLKVERAIKNITQAELAELVGVSRQTINAVEQGKYNLSTILALKIARLFEKNVNDIFVLDEDD